MSSHVDRVRAYLRAHKQMAAPNGILDPDVIYTLGTVDKTYSLTVADLDALCRDAEALADQALDMP